jgi:hypothetical protein
MFALTLDSGLTKNLYFPLVKALSGSFIPTVGAKAINFMACCTRLKTAEPGSSWAPTSLAALGLIPV